MGFQVRAPAPTVSYLYLPLTRLLFAAVFTGGYRSQSIKTWDLRARALVYELATGNTAVHTLTWDDRRAALYAGTECDYRDRLGRTYDYRGAHIPRWAERSPEERRAQAEADGYDSAEESDGEHCWPKRAPHDEKAFGYAYDAGDHVFRECLIYVFDILDATAEHGGCMQCATGLRRTRTRRCCLIMARLGRSMDMPGVGERMDSTQVCAPLALAHSRTHKLQYHCARQSAIPDFSLVC